MDLTADLLGIADVSRRALSQLYRLLNSWRSAPDQLHQLENDVARLSNLLDTVHKAGKIHTRLGNTAAARALNRDVILARDSMESIQNTLRDIVGDTDWSLLPGPSKMRPSGPDAFRRLRWMARKEDIAMAQRNLRLSCQQILCRLVILNIEISTETMTSTKRHESTSSERHEHIDAKIDGISSQIHHLTLRTMQRDDTLSGHGPPSPFAAHPNRTSRNNEAGDTEFRDQSNESRFQHLEEMFTNTTSPLITTPPASPTDRLGFGVMPPTNWAVNLGCACQCRCHRHLTKPRDLRLSTFRTALGSLSFGFSPQLSSQVTCDVKKCRRARAKWIKITYTLPAWLFHATITSVFSNTTGPVEFVLRVCRRIPPHSAVLSTSIHGYIARDNNEQVKRMLQTKEGTVTDIKGDIGRGVIQLALVRRNFEILRLLCQAGADWFQEQDDGSAPYQYALRLLFANHRMSEVDRRMLQNLMPFDAAIDRAELSDLHLVVMRVLSLDLYQCLQLRSCRVNICDGQGKTPLFYAAAMGDVAAVHTLLEAGAEPDFCGSRKLAERSLHIACHHGYIDITKLLVSAGADVNVMDQYQRTPLMLLSTRHCDDPALHRQRQDEVSVQIADYLIKHGANVYAEDSQKNTVLDHLATRDLAVVGEYIIAQHADLDLEHRDWEGSTPLCNAVAFHSFDMVEMLLRHGANLKTIDGNGLNVLHYIANYGNLDTVRLFVRLAEIGVVTGLDLDPAAVTHANATPLQTLDARLDVSKPMRELFQRLLDILYKPSLYRGGGVDPGEQAAQSADLDEFFDAPEFIVRPHKCGLEGLDCNFTCTNQ